MAAPEAHPALRVVVAEGHHLVRRGLRDALAEAGITVVAEVADVASALAAVAEQDPDVLLASLELPGAARGNVVAIARDRWPGLAIVATSPAPSDRAVLAALEHGASAQVSLAAPPEQVIAATRQAAAAPGAFLAEDVAGSRRRASEGDRGLTPREHEVLLLAAEGLTVREMSARLFVSEATTRSHLAGIYRKLGVTSRAQAVLGAVRLGLLQ
ncbi:MAG TPA: response regulator transcription factor [Candidatus Nanopelagicales bacterium]